MDDGGDGFTPNPNINPNPNPPMFGNIDYDFMDQLLDEGCWLQTADGSNFLQPGISTSSSLSSYPSSYPWPTSSVEGEFSSLYQEGKQRWISRNNLSSQDSSKIEENTGEDHSEFQDQKAIITPATARSFCWEGDQELNRIVWIAPMANPGPSTSVKERLMWAIQNLRDMNGNRDVLVQIWVPIKKGLQSFLTTVQQPHFYKPTSKRLLLYRDASEKYEFLADEDTKQALGLPGRVFLGKAPEWTPDVRFFRKEEYPRVNYAQKYDVRGSIALPIFEKGSGDCLGVVEIIMTTQKINYRPEVESVCKALESVNLRSSEIWNTSTAQAGRGSHEAVLPEILSVLRTVCDAHNLPLAQTWAPCSQQGKGACWYCDKHVLCVSTIDSACYVRDPNVLDFHKACSEHHLLRGRGGIVGKAFETNQPCFATDVTEFSKVDYPLSHHAKMYKLRAAVAIRLCSYHESRDYVLEFYLPTDSQEAGLTFHDKIWQSVSLAIQQQCRSLHFIMFKDLEQLTLFGGKLAATNEKKLIESPTSQHQHQEEISWFRPMMNPRRKGKEVAVSLEFGDGEPREEFKVTHWSNSESDLQLGQVFSDCGNIKQDSTSKGIAERIRGSSSGGRLPLGSRKAGERRRTKTQKSISLQVLRQYFAGSLKDAAKSIGVCPTTLKRICRQHGITRWPSRKIKKVGHSLKKLQLVIDSVQGAEGAIKISSFYTNFPELSSGPNSQPRATNQGSSMNLNDQPKQQFISTQPEGGILSSGATTSNSPSTSSSQTSNSSHCISGGAKTSSPLTTTNASGSKDTSRAEDPGGLSFKRARSDAELQALAKKEPNNQPLERSQSNRTLAERPSVIEPPASWPMSKSWPSRDIVGAFKAKATFGEEKVRFTILPNMGFGNLQQEIAKRFNLEDMNKIGIKYLDDDREWVLLTCDDDLEECIDIHKSSGSRTIKLALSASSSLGSYGSSGLS